MPTSAFRWQPHTSSVTNKAQTIKVNPKDREQKLETDLLVGKGGRPSLISTPLPVHRHSGILSGIWCQPLWGGSEPPSPSPSSFLFLSAAPVTFKSPKQEPPPPQRGEGWMQWPRTGEGSFMYMQGTGNSTTELQPGAKALDT